MKNRRYDPLLVGMIVVWGLFMVLTCIMMYYVYVEPRVTPIRIPTVEVHSVEPEAMPMPLPTPKVVEEVYPHKHEPVVTHSDYETELLARMIYTEGRGEEYITKVYLASVAVNRMLDTENWGAVSTIEEVITQKEPTQFTYLIGEPKEKDAWKECLSAAKLVLQEGSYLPIDVQYFYADTCSNRWILKKSVYVHSGQTIFSNWYDTSEEVNHPDCRIELPQVAELQEAINNGTFDKPY